MPDRDERPGGDLIPVSRARGFASTTLPYLLFGAVLLCILCGLPALGYFGYTFYQDQRDISRAATATRDAQFLALAQTTTAEAEAARAAAATATAAADTILAQPPPDWARLYTDDFEPNSADWQVGMSESEWGLLYQEIANGEYVWMADAAANAIFWERLDSVDDLADIYVSAEVSKSVGVPEQVSYGITFRQTSDTDYYYFAVSETGSFALQRQLDGEWTNILDWQDTAWVRPDEVNKLTVRAEGSHFVLLINDRVVGQADDSTFAQGRVGLALNLYREGETATVAFDNFVVWAP